MGGGEELKGGQQKMARAGGTERRIKSESRIKASESRIKSRLHEITAASRAKMVVQRRQKFSKSLNILALHSAMST